MTFGLEEYDKNDGMEMAIRRADEKLYQGKETGRDKIVYWSRWRIWEKYAYYAENTMEFFGKIRYNMLYCEKAYMITREELTKNNGRK